MKHTKNTSDHMDGYRFPLDERKKAQCLSAVRLEASHKR